MSIRIIKPISAPYPAKIDVLVEVDLQNILDGIESLNDIVEDIILGEDVYSMLNDISYQVVGGHSTGNEYIGGKILLRVQAEI